MLYINARFLTQKITGTQRFAIEISKRIIKYLTSTQIEFLAPRNIINRKLAKSFNPKLFGIFKGHLWEQIDLPIYLRNTNDSLLLNLTNTGPLFYRNQIITIHDLAFLRYPQWFSKAFYSYYKFLIPKIAKNSKKIITVSEFSKKELITLLDIPEEKIEVVYNGVSELFKYNPNQRKENFILAVSSLDPRKNFKRLILAFKELNLQDYKLVIVGSENKIFRNSEIKTLIKQIPNIEFTGYISDEKLIQLYQKATLFIYPSLYEGFGLPPLEAMACGTPVIVSNTASLPEICGSAAYYVNPYDKNDIAKGIKTLLENKRLQKDLVQKGLQHVKKFNWDKSAIKITNIINLLT